MIPLQRTGTGLVTSIYHNTSKRANLVKLNVDNLFILLYDGKFSSLANEVGLMFNFTQI
jgi:hypothetical protein